MFYKGNYVKVSALNILVAKTLSFSVWYLFQFGKFSFSVFVVNDY